MKDLKRNAVTELTLDQWLALGVTMGSILQHNVRGPEAYTPAHLAVLGRSLQESGGNLEPIEIGSLDGACIS